LNPLDINNNAMHLLCGFLLFSALVSPFSWAESRKPPPFVKGVPPLAQFMRQVAENYGSVRSQRKVVEATDVQRLSAILDTVSVSGSTYRNRGEVEGSPSPGAPAFGSTDFEGKGRSYGATFSLSLATFLQVEGLQISKEIQEAILKATKMRLATEAATAHFEYYNNEIRKYYIGLIARSLNDLHVQVLRGKVNLSEANLSLLQSKINEIRGISSTIENQIAISSIEIERLSGRKPRTLQEATEDLPLESARSSRFEDPFETAFSIPASPQEAHRLAAQSPVIIQADLNERTAHNRWKLSLAAFGPRFTVSVNKGITEATFGTVPEIQQNFETKTITASVSFSLSGGAFTNIKATSLLEEAASIAAATTEMEIKASISKLYPTLGFHREQMSLSKSIIARSSKGLQSFPHRNDERFQEYIGLINSLNSSVQIYQTSSTQLVMTKIRIHGLMGTLLGAIVKQEKKEKPAL